MENKFDMANIWRFAGMLVGLIAIIIGIGFSADSGSTHAAGSLTYSEYRNVRFGADFYTEIHAAVSEAVNRLGFIGSELTELSNDITVLNGNIALINDILGWLFILSGAVTICAFGSKLNFQGKSEYAQQAPQNQQYDQPQDQQPPPRQSGMGNY